MTPCWLGLSLIVTLAVAGPPPDTLWLYGELYDVSSVDAWHPGGAAILRQTRGLVLPDATPLFESMHSLRDADEMRQKLLPFRVNATAATWGYSQPAQQQQMYTFEEGGFYRVLRKRVSAFLSAQSEGEVPAAPKGGIRMMGKWAMFMICFFGLLVASVRTQSIFSASLLCGAAGIFMTMAAFSMLHDASHYAAFTRDAESTDFASRIAHTFMGWDMPFWRAHHVLLHHTYTGHRSMDPDLWHGAPHWCKMPSHYECEYSSTWWQFLTSLAGMHTGQSILYLAKRLGLISSHEPPTEPYGTNRRGSNSLVEVKGVHFEGWQWWQYIVGSWWIVLAVALYRSVPRRRRPKAGVARRTLAAWRPLAKVVVGLTVYNLGVNLGYSANILVDHDTQATHQNLAGYEYATIAAAGGEAAAASRVAADWGEVQLRGTANWAGPIWCFFFGGINYQIEHHLFPTVYNAHYPSIAPIVRSTAREFDLPYAQFDTVAAGLASAYGQYQHAQHEAHHRNPSRNPSNPPIGVVFFNAVTYWHVGCFLGCLFGTVGLAAGLLTDGFARSAGKSVAVRPDGGLMIASKNR